MDMPNPDLIATIQGMAQKAAAPEKAEPGPGDVGATVDTKNQVPLVSLPMTEEEVGQWWDRIERARKRVKARETEWDVLLNEYLPIVSKSGQAETVKNNSHFRNVHSKIGQLFYRSPDLLLTPKDPSPAQNSMPNPMQDPMGPPLPPLLLEDIIAVKQAVLKEKLGRDGIKANRLMDELLFDVLAWAGIGCAKLGYRCVFKEIQQPVMGPDPNQPVMPQQPGSILGLGGMPAPPPQVPQMDQTGQPLMQTVKVPVFEEWYSRRFSPKKALWNDDLKSTRFDEDTTWMGMEFYISAKRAMKDFGLTEEEASRAADDDRVHKYKEDEQGGKAPGLVHCVELYCKASVFTDEVHPQAYNQLVLIEGIKTKPVVWRPSPDQEFDEMGKLTVDSLIGNPYQVLTIRDLADSCFPPSDAAFTNSFIKQLSTWRRQSIRLRDAAIGKYLYDTGAFEQEELDQLKNGEIGEFIGVTEGKLQNGVEKIFAPTTRVSGSVDDQRGAHDIKQDMDETLGIGSNQAGVETETVRTATESNNVANAIQARNEKELGRVVDFYLDMARKIDSLIMRYADTDEYVKVGGDEGAGRMQMWNNKIVSGKYLYDIMPDSQLRVDTARDFQQMLNFYNIVAPDPLTNRAYLLRRLARMKGLDPAKVVMDPLSMAMQPPHGGAAQAGATVSQHTASNSGGKPNAPGATNHREEQVK